MAERKQFPEEHYDPDDQSMKAGDSVRVTVGGVEVDAEVVGVSETDGGGLVTVIHRKIQ